MGNANSGPADYESSTSESSDIDETFENEGEDAQVGNRAFQFKIALRGVKPRVWRRVQVPDDYDFLQLHKALNTAMGWKGYHLYEFRGPGDIIIGEKDEEDFEGFGGTPKTLVSKDMKIADVFSPTLKKMVYFYDFGDGWFHSLLLEKVIPREKGVSYPRCIKGQNACPPEDCGGTEEYFEFLGTLEDTQHEKHAENKEWLEKCGYPNFSPDSFDLASVNALLKN